MKMMIRLAVSLSSILLFAQLPLFAQSVDPRIANFEAELAVLAPELLKEFATPGASVALIRDRKVAWIGAFGFGSLAPSVRLKVDSAFNVGSISKLVTAWGVSSLAQKGEIDLNSPVSSYLKRWQIPGSKFTHDTITPARILSHTAGFSMGGWKGWGKDKAPSLIDFLSGKTDRGAVVVYTQPGTTTSYSGAGYAILELALEDRTVMNFSQLMEKEVFDPLGMKHSSYAAEPSKQIQKLLVTPYDFDLVPVERERFAGTSAAGLISNVIDLSKLMVAELNPPTSGRFDKTTVESMWTPVSPSTRSGMGHFVQTIGDIRVIGHTGLNVGWNTAYEFIPERGVGIIVLTNGDNGQYVVPAIVCRWLHNNGINGIHDHCVAAPQKHLRRAEDDIEANRNNLGLTEQQSDESLRAVQDSIKLLDDKKFAETKQKILPVIKLLKSVKTRGSKTLSTVISDLERCIFWLNLHILRK